MQLSFILQTREADWGNLPARTSIHRREHDFRVYYCLQLVDTVKYILKHIFVYIIKEQGSDEGESE